MITACSTLFGIDPNRLTLGAARPNQVLGNPITRLTNRAHGSQ